MNLTKESLEWQVGLVLGSIITDINTCTLELKTQLNKVMLI
jgi:hypothetical protein